MKDDSFNEINILVFEKVSDLSESRKYGLIQIILMNKKEQKEQTQPFDIDKIGSSCQILDRDWFLDSLAEWKPIHLKIIYPKIYNFISLII